MQYTSQQVAQKLGISRSQVVKLVQTGKLIAINKPEDGKRVNYKFDSKTIMEFKKTFTPAPNSKGRRKKVTLAVSAGPGEFRKQLTDLQTEVAEMKAMLVQLCEMWK
jgi:hypothetical protein